MTRRLMNGCSAWIAATVLAAAFFWFALGFHIRHTPTPDELYGCTVEQQAPNGECK